jgi:hypothetical protein
VHTCTFLHPRLEEGEADEVIAVTKPPQEAAEPTAVCVICGDPYPVSDGIRCPEDDSHFVCTNCLATYVENFVEQDHPPGSAPSVRCPAVDGGRCSGVLPDLRIIKLVSDEVAVTLQEFRARCVQALAFSEGVEEAKKLAKQTAAARDAAERELLGKQFRQSMPNALMCPRCRCGPVDFGHCADLGAHHGQRVPGGGVIDNSCPRCRFFTFNRSEWYKWDGVVRGIAEEVAAAAASAVAAPSPAAASPGGADRLMQFTACARPVADALLRLVGGDIRTAADLFYFAKGRPVDDCLFREYNSSPPVGDQQRRAVIPLRFNP